MSDSTEFSKKDDIESNMLDIVALKKYFPIKAGLLKRIVGNVRAVDDVSFYIKRGETLGLVGESGCGKTTVGRTIMMLTPPSEGFVFFESPKSVVGDFKTLFLISEKGKTNDLSEKEIELGANLINKMLENPSCMIKEDKKKQICDKASKFSKEFKSAKLSGSDKGAQKELLSIADDAIEQVAKKYCLNLKKKKDVRKLRARMQFVFQDPFSSLNPRMLIKNIVSEPIIAQQKFSFRRKKTKMLESGDNKTKPDDSKIKSSEKAPTQIEEISRSEEINRKVIALLERVGLNVEHMYRYPHEFSGGQRQRIGIARALSVGPDFIVLDEPTSALDVSVQAQILNMLNDLQKDFGLTYLFISHDLSTIRYMCDRVAVMYLGKIVESAPKLELFGHPTHPYTEALLSVIPVPDPDYKKDRIILAGDVPSPANPPPGCRFHTRCPLAIPVCSIEEPALTDYGNEHFVACHVRKEVVK